MNRHPLGKWLDFIADSLDGTVEENRYREERLFQRMIEDIRKQTIDPDMLSEIKDEAAWEKAKARFAEEGWREGRKDGKNEGILAQQRQTIMTGKQMGMEVAAIARLVGLTETKVPEVLNQPPSAEQS